MEKLKEIQKSLIEVSKMFKGMSDKNLAEAEAQVQKLQQVIDSIVNPRLMDEMERNNPDYQAFKAASPEMQKELAELPAA